MNESFEIIDELDDAPFLKSLKKDSTDSTVPEGYFEGFSDRMLDMIEDAAAREEAPVLFAISQKPQYMAPEGYFEHFIEQLEVRISPAKVVDFRSKSRFSRFGLMASQLAAAVTLLVGIWLLTPQPTTIQTTGMTTEELVGAIDWAAYDTRTLEEAFGDDLLDAESSSSSESIPELEMLDENDLSQIYLN